MTAEQAIRNSQEATDYFQMPPPSNLTMVAIITALTASKLTNVSYRSMWQILSTNNIECDGPTACQRLLELGLLTPTGLPEDERRIWAVPEGLQDATLAARISAKLWIEAVIEYLQAPQTEREELLESTR